MTISAIKPTSFSVSKILQDLLTSQFKTLEAFQLDSPKRPRALGIFPTGRRTSTKPRGIPLFPLGNRVALRGNRVLWPESRLWPVRRGILRTVTVGVATWLVRCRGSFPAEPRGGETNSTGRPWWFEALGGLEVLRTICYDRSLVFLDVRET